MLKTIKNALLSVTFCLLFSLLCIFMVYKKKKSGGLASMPRYFSSQDLESEYRDQVDSNLQGEHNMLF